MQYFMAKYYTLFKKIRENVFTRTAESIPGETSFARTSKGTNDVDTLSIDVTDRHRSMALVNV